MHCKKVLDIQEYLNINYKNNMQKMITKYTNNMSIKYTKIQYIIEK